MNSKGKCSDFYQDSEFRKSNIEVGPVNWKNSIENKKFYIKKVEFRTWSKEIGRNKFEGEKKFNFESEKVLSRN